VPARRGAALLEALVAVAILGTAGVAFVAIGAESAEVVRRAQAADEESRAASAFLEAVALWPREDLDRRLGSRRQGPWVLRVDRPWPALYVASLRDSSDRRELLRTALYRAEVAGGAR
jgi:hypothetical protein